MIRKRTRKPIPGFATCQVCTRYSTMGTMIHPCRCESLNLLVHKDCFEHWLILSKITRCAKCGAKYRDALIGKSWLSEVGSAVTERLRKHHLTVADLLCVIALWCFAFALGAFIGKFLDPKTEKKVFGTKVDDGPSIVLSVNGSVHPTTDESEVLQEHLGNFNGTIPTAMASENNFTSEDQSKAFSSGSTGNDGDQDSLLAVNVTRKNVFSMLRDALSIVTGISGSKKSKCHLIGNSQKAEISGHVNNESQGSDFDCIVINGSKSCEISQMSMENVTSYNEKASDEDTNIKFDVTGRGEEDHIDETEDLKSASGNTHPVLMMYRDDSLAKIDNVVNDISNGQLDVVEVQQKMFPTLSISVGKRIELKDFSEDGLISQQANDMLRNSTSTAMRGDSTSRIGGMNDPVEETGKTRSIEHSRITCGPPGTNASSVGSENNDGDVSSSEQDEFVMTSFEETAKQENQPLSEISSDLTNEGVELQTEEIELHAGISDTNTSSTTEIEQMHFSESIDVFPIPLSKESCMKMFPELASTIKDEFSAGVNGSNTMLTEDISEPQISESNDTFQITMSNVDNETRLQELTSKIEDLSAGINEPKTILTNEISEALPIPLNTVGDMTNIPEPTTMPTEAEDQQTRLSTTNICSVLTTFKDFGTIYDDSKMTSFEEIEQKRQSSNLLENPAQCAEVFSATACDMNDTSPGEVTNQVQKSSDITLGSESKEENFSIGTNESSKTLDEESEKVYPETTPPSTTGRNIRCPDVLRAGNGDEQRLQE